WCGAHDPRPPTHPYGLESTRMGGKDSGVVRKLGEGVSTQVSSSSSDRCSKFRCPSQNSPRVASRRDMDN
ncbi:hypothetical protein AVEN_70346-1, partial [Araneus ventricosus]